MKRYLGLVIAAFVLGGSMQTSADKAISITVRPAVATVHSSARLTVLIARNEKNRSLVWEVDGPNYYRSSSTEIAGADAPRSYFFTVRDLPAGEFEVRATIKRSDRTEASDRGRILIVGGPSN